MRNIGRRALGVAALTWSMLIPGTVVIAAPAEAAAAPPLALSSRASITSGPVATALTGTATAAPTPPMGFNDWNSFGCDVNEALIEQTADAFISTGLAAAGYQYVNIDDCWSLKERGADGRLVPDPVKFPKGIKGLADYVHGKGLKLGIYGDAGTKTCGGYPGSLGTEDLDAQTWADWGVDYLKYDNCSNQSDGSREDFVRRYTAMRTALDKTGRPIVYSICEWGQSQPWQWATGVGNLWRTTGDISANWSSIRSIVAQNALLAQYAGPGHWNDPDMLEVGNNGLTDLEYRSHMSMWAMMAAPLIIGTDLRRASAATLAILGNKDIIAIDQDPLGVQGAVVVNTGGLMVLNKPLANGEHAIALYNSTDSLAEVSVPANALGLKPASGYRLQDVWTGNVLQAKTTIAAAVPAHGTVVYRVRPDTKPVLIAPAVTVTGGLATLIPGSTTGGTLTTTLTNRGFGPIKSIAVTAQAPAGWTVTPSTLSTRWSLSTDASLETTWTVKVPVGTSAGRYPITVTASYIWGRDRTPATTSSDIIGVVVTAPADGRRHLSTVPQVKSTNAVGPVEIDQSNGGQSEADGALLTIGGTVYTRGLGTSGNSEVVYYLGGRCSQLVTAVGIDDELATTVPASFTIYADDTAAASSGSVAAGQAPRTLTADLAGATWLRLVTTGSALAPDGTTSYAHTDWAAPILSCGATGPNDPVLPVSKTLYSFESGTEDWTTANPGSGGTVAQSTVFHTDGDHGLEVITPSGGNWFGKALATPIDLTGSTMLRFDVKTGAASGTSGEIALQVGPDSSWCQGGLWAWTNASSTKTVTEKISQISCSAGVTLDLTQIRGVWVFLNGGDVYVDNVRAE